MITISVCMIVKNEEQVLARCLDSLKGIADEIIIVDTGSTDSTKEIAGRYTDKIYDFQWIDDFSAARNFSFSKATQEYIYVADADEVIEETERQRFISLKETLDPSIEIVQMLYTNQLQFNTTYNFDEELRPKLYRRLRNFVWQEPLHEAVRLEPVIIDTDIRIKHMPLSQHSGRDFKVFLRAIERDGDLSAHLMGMYARELMVSGEKEDFIKAVPFFQAKLETAADEDAIKQILCVLTRAARMAENEELFFACALKNMALEKSSSEVCYEIGEYFFEKKNIYEAVIWYYNAIYETEPELNVRVAGSLAAGRLAECYENMDQAEEAVKYRELEKDFLAQNR